MDYGNMYCVIGAGPSGLAAAKNLQKLGIPYVVFEKHSRVGGIWDVNNESSTCYDSTYTITSKKVTAYTDFPIEEHMPDYMHHTQVLSYLNSYAQHFDLLPNIQFGVKVTKIEKQNDHWKIDTTRGSHLFAGVIIANGHNWSPVIPDVVRSFTGRCIHSANYKNPDDLRGQNVLVIGAGNTGCDIAVETSHVTRQTQISMRRGYYFVPKYMFGMPSDEFGSKSQSGMIPISLIQRVYQLLLRIVVGPIQRFGLPMPDHKILESPPIVNSLLPYYVSHGRVKVKSNVTVVSGNKVTFADGSSSDVDTIICATGYKIDFPFIDQKYLSWKGNRPDFYLMAFHPDYDNLFIAGLTDGTGGHFPTVDLQTQVIAHYIKANADKGRFADEINHVKRNGNLDFSNGIRFIESDRSYTQFELVKFQKYMKKLIGRAEKLSLINKKYDVSGHINFVGESS